MKYNTDPFICITGAIREDDVDGFKELWNKYKKELYNYDDIYDILRVMVNYRGDAEMFRYIHSELGNRIGDIGIPINEFTNTAVILLDANEIEKILWEYRPSYYDVIVSYTRRDDYSREIENVIFNYMQPVENLSLNDQDYENIIDHINEGNSDFISKLIDLEYITHDANFEEGYYTLLAKLGKLYLLSHDIVKYGAYTNMRSEILDILIDIDIDKDEMIYFITSRIISKNYRTLIEAIEKHGDIYVNMINEALDRMYKGSYKGGANSDDKRRLYELLGREVD